VGHAEVEYFHGFERIMLGCIKKQEALLPVGTLRRTVVGFEPYCWRILMKKEQLFMAILLFAVMAISRLVPHPANFTAMVAVALFAGSFWRGSNLRFIVPLAAMFATDLYLGMYPGAMFNYVALALGVLVAPLLLASAWRVLASGVVASVIFFVVSNLGVWWSTGLYPRTGAGLIDCYIMGLPFLQNTVVSTLFYSFVIYGAYRLLFAPTGLEGFFNLNYGRSQR